MTETEAARILLVRAVEEARPDAVPPEALIDALTAAGEMDDEGAWLARRADFLLAHVLVAYRPVLGMIGAVGGWTGWMLGVPLVVGLASNYLGPSAKIHVLLNPIALLILWNVGVYLALAAHAAHSRLRPGAGAAPPVAAAPLPAESPAASADVPAARAAPGPGPLRRLLLRRLIPGAWLRWHRAAGDAAALATVRATDLAAVGRTFWAQWMPLGQPVLLAGVRRALHLGAIGLALGAILGMYARGLFFEYDVVWRSTFIRDPSVFVGAIRLVLGPAALVLGRPLPDEAEAALLVTREGAPAAPWIHLWAAAALLYVVVPRLVLAAAATLRMRTAGRRVRLDFGQAYYRTIVEGARTLRVAHVAAAIQTDVRVECAKFAESLATFVCEKLYDGRIAPAIRAFRREGGRVSDLEERIVRECEAFGAEIGQYLPVAQRDFEQALARAVERTVGASLGGEEVSAEGLGATVGGAAAGSGRAAGGSVGYGLADTVGAAVAAAVAVTAGTVSGGFGKALGVALLVGVVHSGPVAWVIGALGGLLLAGAGLFLGRDLLAGGVKQVALPAAIVRATLWEGRVERLIAEGRTRCHATVREAMDRELAPLTAQISEQIWTRVKPLLGERQRHPAPGAGSTEDT